MIKVSIIIPVYNTKQYLAECLDSVLGQTLKEIEVICVNDGSTDGSLQVLKDYSKRDCRVVVIDKENEGAGASRNKGLGIAKGEAVIFFDSDDFMAAPSALEVMYNRLMVDNSDLLVCRANDVDEDSNDIAIIGYGIEATIIGECRLVSPKDYADKIFRIFVGWPWDKLYRRGFVVDNGLQFQNLRHSNDTSFVLTSLTIAEKISCIDDCFVSHRKHGDSISQTREAEPTCFIDALAELYSQMRNRGVYEVFKTSFLTYCVTFGYWHYSTIGNEVSREAIKERFAIFVEDHNLLELKSRSLRFDKAAYVWLREKFSKSRIFLVSAMLR